MAGMSPDALFDCSARLTKDALLPMTCGNPPRLRQIIIGSVPLWKVMSALGPTD
jgi:hypothetical protein